MSDTAPPSVDALIGTVPTLDLPSLAAVKRSTGKGKGKSQDAPLNIPVSDDIATAHTASSAPTPPATSAPVNVTGTARTPPPSIQRPLTRQTSAAHAGLGAVTPSPKGKNRAPLERTSSSQDTTPDEGPSLRPRASTPRLTCASLKEDVVSVNTRIDAIDAAMLDQKQAFANFDARLTDALGNIENRIVSQVTTVLRSNLDAQSSQLSDGYKGLLADVDQRLASLQDQIRDVETSVESAHHQAINASLLARNASRVSDSNPTTTARSSPPSRYVANTEGSTGTALDLPPQVNHGRMVAPFPPPGNYTPPGPPGSQPRFQRASLQPVTPLPIPVPSRAPAGQQQPRPVPPATMGFSHAPGAGRGGGGPRAAKRSRIERTPADLLLGPLGWNPTVIRAQFLDVACHVLDRDNRLRQNLVNVCIDADADFARITYCDLDAASSFVNHWANSTHKPEYMGVHAYINEAPSQCDDQLSICSWNVHGKLALKLMLPGFQALISEHDAVFLQETHLRMGQELQLQLPPGYVILATSRPENHLMEHSGGGVAVIAKHSLGARCLPCGDSPDVQVVAIGRLIVVNVYLPPAGSPWLACLHTPPEHRLSECVAPLLAHTSEHDLLVVGDLNGRTGVSSAHTRDYPRMSPDNAPLNTRGRAILKLCEDFDLVIVNGTSLHSPNSRDVYTSFQPNGFAIVDYILAHVAAAKRPSAIHLDVRPRIDTWSDHAQLVIHYRSTNDTTSLESISHATSTSSLRSPPLGNPRNNALDLLLCNTLKQRRNSPAEGIRALYGPVWQSSNPIHVWTDGSSAVVNGHRLAGAGVYWGCNARANCAVRVPGELQTNNRAELYAVLVALHMADPRLSLAIHSDSTYTIHSICHWAVRNADPQWACAHGDLLRAIQDTLRRRLAPVTFYWVKAHTGDNPNEHADRLAASGRSLPPSTDLLSCSPPADWPMPPCDTPELPLLKAHTTLPANASPLLPPLLSSNAATALRENGANAPLNGLLVEQDDHTQGATSHVSTQVSEYSRSLYSALAEATNEGRFWSVLKDITRPSPPVSLVTAEELRAVFQPRMNPQRRDHNQPSSILRSLDHILVESLPLRTADCSTLASFSRAITLEDIAAVKARLAALDAGKARGPDGVSYEDVLDIPNSDLRILFQARPLLTCLDSLDCPQRWLTATLAAVQKKGKAASDPSGYRNIGLESCLLKTLTLLVDRRLREWADTDNLVPPLQNGFREGFRTENNIFTLRTAIEHARAHDKTLWVALVDLTNAFPSVDQAVLWAKLRAWGAGGPLYDWMRMLYSRLLYFVRHNAEYSALFQSLAGILIGDPASPILWNLFFADFTCERHSDDVFLDALWIPFLAQADDILLLSTSSVGLQEKINALVRWCLRNGLTINETKTLLMAFGPLPPSAPRISLYGSPLVLAQTAPYVGALLCSTTRNVFSKHSAEQARKARRIANATLSLESYIGAIPLDVARTLYLARIDPHLLSNSAVNLDVSNTELAELESVQHVFLRRVSRLPHHAQVLPLLLDLGLWPLRYRRAVIAVRYLSYLVTTAPAVPRAAIAAATSLARSGHASWMSDLKHVLRRLPVPVAFDCTNLPSSDVVQRLITAIEGSLTAYSVQLIGAGTKLVLWRKGMLPSLRGPRNPRLLFALRAYTLVTNVKARRALARLLCGVPPYAIETLRWEGVARERRICRFCRSKTVLEDEQHVLFDCPDSELQAARNTHHIALLTALPSLLHNRRTLDDWRFLATTLLHAATAPISADLVLATFARFETTEPVRFGSEDEWNALA